MACTKCGSKYTQKCVCCEDCEKTCAYCSAICPECKYSIEDCRCDICPKCMGHGEVVDTQCTCRECSRCGGDNYMCPCILCRQCGQVWVESEVVLKTEVYVSAVYCTCPECGEEVWVK